MVVLDTQKIARLEKILAKDHIGLLVVDVQNDFLALNGKSAKEQNISDMRAVLTPIEQVIALFRTLERPVIWTKDYEDPEFRTTAGLDRFLWLEENDKATVACLKGTAGAEFFVQPATGERIIEKTKTSAYVNTSLKETISEMRIKTLVVVGVKTQRCVARTVHDLYENEADLHVVVLEDCVASDDQLQHEAAIAELKKFYPPVMSSSDLMANLTALR